MALLAPDTEIVCAADGRVHAEGAGGNPPRSPVPSDFTDELPSVVASVERIDAWMEMAEAGDVFVYATRARLPIASAGRKRMLDLAKRNLVCLTQVRSTLDPSIFSYRATRTTTPTAMTKPIRPLLTAHLVDAEAAIVDALLPVLSRAARFARPCPTDKQLAERTQLPIASIQPGLAALSAAGLIRIEALPAPTRRRVIIIATGAQTGLIA